MKADNNGGDRYSDQIRDSATRTYIKDDIHLLTDFSKQNCLGAEKVIAMLKEGRYNEGKESGDTDG